jgi:acyl-ACP thioesterase
VGQHTVLLSDLDIVNHANSVKYLEWCLDAAPIDVVLQQRIASIEMNYLKEVSWQDTVALHLETTPNLLTYSLQRESKVCFALQLALHP